MQIVLALFLCLLVLLSPPAPVGSGSEPADEQSAYEMVMKDISPYATDEVPGFWVVKTLEADACTVILAGVGGLPHPLYGLYLVYKPDSSMSEGEMVKLPLQTSVIGGVYKPDVLWLSEDCRTLYYTYHFDEREECDGRVMHEAGTYTYTVDLSSAEVSADFAAGQA